MSDNDKVSRDFFGFALNYLLGVAFENLCYHVHTLVAGYALRAPHLLFEIGARLGGLFQTKPFGLRFRAKRGYDAEQNDLSVNAGS